jgi:hypothetical protein
MRLRDGWASRTFWFRLAKMVDVHREQFGIAGDVTSGFVMALEYDGATGCNPFIDFVRREFGMRGAARIKVRPDFS